MLNPKQREDNIEYSSTEGFLGPKMQGIVPSRPKYRKRRVDAGFQTDTVFAKAEVDASNKMWLDAGLSHPFPLVRPDVSPAVKAKKLFLQRIKELDERVNVVTDGGDSGEQSFTLFVNSGDVQTEMTIYEIKAEILRSFPLVNFRTHVREKE